MFYHWNGFFFILVDELNSSGPEPLPTGMASDLHARGISFNEFISLSEIQLLMLSATFHAECNFSTG